MALKKAIKGVKKDIVDAKKEFKDEIADVDWVSKLNSKDIEALRNEMHEVHEIKEG